MATRIAPPARRHSQLQVYSSARFRARFRDGLTALTGQVGTLSRASTSTALDTSGGTITVGYGRPRWESRAWDGSNQALGLRLSTDDLTFPCDWLPESATIAVRFMELGTRTTTNAGLLYVGNDGVSGARLIIDATGSNYRATIHNGTTGQSATLSGSKPASNAGATLLVQLDDNGTTQRVRIGLQVVGDTFSWSSWSSTVTRAAAWGAGAKLRLNRTGSGGTQGSTWLQEVAWVPGALTIDEIMGRL